MILRRRICLAVFLLCTPPAFGQQSTAPCALTPLTPPKPGANMFTPVQEEELGDFFADQVAARIRPIEDKELSAELERIGAQLVKHLPPSQLNFRFYLSDAPETNAMSLVGGRVYVTRKLIGIVRSEDELAGVLGHELGHIVTHQQAKLYTRVFREKLGITEVGDRKDLYQKVNRMYDEWTKHGTITVDPEKDQQEADRTGLEAVVRAGYAPQALAEFWDRFTENKGKTGSWFSEMLQSTQPDTKRYREMTKELVTLPAACRDLQPAGASDAFRKWQTAVVNFKGVRTRDELHNVVWQKKLDPPLQDAVHTLKFSSDGKYVLAQDGGNIFVLSHEPFQTLFRINAADAYPARFTPDSTEIVFYDRSLRVERWSLKTQEQVSTSEVYVHHQCMQTLLSPDGKTLACYRSTRDLTLVDVASGEHLLEKKDFLEGKVEVGNEALDTLRIQYTLQYINLGFSPDGRYFVAALKNEHNLIYDIRGKREIPVPGPLKGYLGTAFAFITPDRIIGHAGARGEKSAIVEFPSGKVIRQVDLGGARPTPATHGDYILIRPIKDFAVGILDVNANQIVGANKQSAMDVYDKQYVSELKNGQIGLFGAAPAPMAVATLPRSALGTVRTAALSDDLNWLAVSEKMRGAVWALPTSSRVLNLREFRGAYISPEGVLFADFPKHDATPRSVARIALQQRQFTEALKDPNATWKQRGEYLVNLRSANKPNDSAAKPDEKTEEAAEAPVEGLNWHVEETNVPQEVQQNTVFEVRKVETGELLWSQAFPKQTPRYFVHPSHKTVCFVWLAGQDAAKNELKAHTDWRGRVTSVADTDVLVEVNDLGTGKLLGGAIIGTGGGSYEINEVWAESDLLLLTDDRERTILYSLSSGKERGKEVGSLVAFSQAAGSLCLQKVPGRLEIYSLETMEKTDEFAFSSQVSMAAFVGGKRLFVLTADQTGYLLEPATTSHTAANSGIK
ncbi:MAG TPA: M48 family metalloprotease [Candidatus Acidoferrum sp.]|nr:M48 family metalloprotease [Candidatus Acidoferrum sp.]